MANCKGSLLELIRNHELILVIDDPRLSYSEGIQCFDMLIMNINQKSIACYVDDSFCSFKDMELIFEIQFHKPADGYDKSAIAKPQTFN